MRAAIRGGVRPSAGASALAAALCALLGCAVGCEQTPPQESESGRAEQDLLAPYAHGFNTLGEHFQPLADALDRPDGGPPEPAGEALEAAFADAEKAFAHGRAASASRAPELAQLAEALVQSAAHLLAARRPGASGGEDASARHEAARRFRKSLYALGNALEGLEDEQMAAEIRSRAGQKAHGYWFRLCIVEAKKLLRQAQRLPDPAVFSPGLQELERAQAGLAALLGPQAEKASQALAAFVERASAYRNLARSLAAQPLRAEDRRALDAAFNALVDAGNALYELESQGVL
ncbi:MAG: hypothetical protein JXR96_28315 [Deltaproteobacteria bacterium]|nr:hypothetical protein [Deltaproteobacteria bacterium]